MGLQNIFLCAEQAQILFYDEVFYDKLFLHIYSFYAYFHPLVISLLFVSETHFSLYTHVCFLRNAQYSIFMTLKIYFKSTYSYLSTLCLCCVCAVTEIIIAYHQMSRDHFSHKFQKAI